MASANQVLVQRLAEALEEVGVTEAQATADAVEIPKPKVRLSVTSDPTATGECTVLVGDRIPADVKTRFETDAAGWLDRRQLWLRTDGLIVFAPITPRPGIDVSERAVRVLAGAAVSAVTLNALMRWPEPMIGVRALAERAGVSPGGVSLAAGRLVEAGLLTEDRRATRTLFWEAAREWKPRWVDTSIDIDSEHVRTPGRSRPAVGGVEEGLMEIGARVAAEAGAPIPADLNAPREFIASTETVVRLAEFGSTSPQPVRVTVAPSPVAVPAPDDEHLEGRDVIVALVLATDRGRGREIVETWEGRHVWA